MTGPIYSLRGSLEDEITFDFREIFPEECGLAAAINLPVASSYVSDMLMLQGHRGQDAAGIISSKKGKFFGRRRVGNVKHQFRDFNFKKKLPGNMSIGHNRYPTKGGTTSPENVQPIPFRDNVYGSFFLGHNGTLNHVELIKNEMIDNYTSFRTSSDTEVFGHLMIQSGKETIEEAIIDAADKVKGAYAILVQTKDKIIALRDRFGVRPLSLASLDDGFLIASETYVFDQFDAEFERDIKAGEMLIFERNKEAQSIQYAEPNEHFCMMEGIYFSNPRSMYKGIYHEDFRKAQGAHIAKCNPGLKADKVIPILDSGKQPAWGFAKAAGIEYDEAFLRIHDPPKANDRSFTARNQKERVKAAFKKLHLRDDKVKGLDIILVDDSIVRSTTIKTIIERVKSAGARSVTVVITAPAIINICPNGMAYTNKKELIAANNSIDEIRQEIGADNLIYSTLNQLEETNKQTYNCGGCTGCFGGRYPIELLN